MTTNGNPPADLPPPTTWDENTHFDVGSATLGDQPVLWIRSVQRMQDGHFEVRSVVLATVDEALALSRRIRDIALELAPDPDPEP